MSATYALACGHTVVVRCHNGHPFVPGVSTDHASGESDPRWCNTCGEADR